MNSGENEAEAQEVLDLGKQDQWEARPNEEIKIPEVYIRQLQYEIVVLSEKRTFTFRCLHYTAGRHGEWLFTNVIIDSSKLNAKGELELKRITYHPQLSLVNASFMVLPAPEEIGAD